MARALTCVVLVLLFACSGDSGEAERLRADLQQARAAADELGADLGRARARIRSMEREARRPPPPPDPARFVDLWHGGPTIRGPLLGLPRLGVLRWTCNFEGRFRIVYRNGGATTRVSYAAPRSRESATTHSDGSLTATIREGETVTWTITHRHPPGFIRARIAVSAEMTKHGSCVLPRVELKEAGRAYD